VGRKAICFAEGLKQRGWKKEREQEGKTDICQAAPAFVTNDVFVQTRAHTRLPGQFCCHMPHTRQSHTSKLPSTY